MLTTILKILPNYFNSQYASKKAEKIETLRIKLTNLRASITSVYGYAITIFENTKNNDERFSESHQPPPLSKPPDYLYHEHYNEIKLFIVDNKKYIPQNIQITCFNLNKYLKYFPSRNLIDNDFVNQYNDIQKSLTDLVTKIS